MYSSHQSHVSLYLIQNITGQKNHIAIIMNVNNFLMVMLERLAFCRLIVNSQASPVFARHCTGLKPCANLRGS